MRFCSRQFAALFLSTASVFAADPLFDGMKAELQRAQTLSLGQLDKPYYISYGLDEGRVWSGSATFGGLVSSSSSRFRIPEIRLRVGDYKFDNMNYAGGFGGGPRYDLRAFPLEDDPLVARHYYWLATDSAYKGALQTIARKRAALRNITQNEALPDFAPAPKFTLLREFKPATFDSKAWDDRIRKVSGVFNAFPALRTSLVEYSAVDGFHRFVSTEGTEVERQESLGSVQIRASGQAKDGMIVRDWALFYATDLSKLFPEADLSKAATQVGEQVVKLAAAPLGENYSGPIMFEGIAAPQLLAEVLGRNLHITRKLVGPPGAASQSVATELEGRRGVRIMPESFDVVDDPTKPGFGHEEVDDEGVPGKPLQLVEKGVLKDFLRTRTPVRGYNESNGRARLSGGNPAPSNLIITAKETSSLADLKKKIIDLCQQRGLTYGIIIRKMDFPSTAPLEEARKILSAAGASGRAVSQPLYVYKLYLDGREELIRGVRIRGLNARSLKDILAAGNDTNTLNYLENGAPFALLGYGGSSASVSVAAPSVVIDDLELIKIDDEQPSLPIAPAPALSLETAPPAAPAR
ncbi:MAG: peptidase modulator of gyrase [Bryobacterales bacterium]|nr:peptidase modulator of gyrase [Bryobacterales bacterium]